MLDVMPVGISVVVENLKGSVGSLRAVTEEAPGPTLCAVTVEDPSSSLSGDSSENFKTLRQIVMDNAALGAALKTIVDDFDIIAGTVAAPVVREVPVGPPVVREAADGTPVVREVPVATPVVREVAVGTPVVREAAGEATGKSLLTGAADVSLPSDAADADKVVSLPALPQLVSENAALGATLVEQASEVQTVVAAVAREVPVAAPVAREVPVGTPVVREVPVAAPVVREVAAGTPVVREVAAGTPVVREVAAGTPVVREAAGEATSLSLPRVAGEISREAAEQRGEAPVAVDSAVTSVEATGKSLPPDAADAAKVVSLPALPQLVSENAALGATLVEQTSEVQTVVAAVAREVADGTPVVREVADGTPAVREAAEQRGEAPVAVDSAVTSAEATGKSLPPVAAGVSLPSGAGELPQQGVSLSSGSDEDVASPLAAAPVAVQVPVVARGGDEGVASPQAASLVQAADAVAEAILVSPDLKLGSGEIRIQLKPDVLDGSVVSVAVTGRQVEITFIPASHEVAVLLAGNQSLLAAQLANRIRSFNVSVDVRRSSSYDSEERV